MVSPSKVINTESLRTEYSGECLELSNRRTQKDEENNMRRNLTASGIYAIGVKAIK